MHLGDPIADERAGRSRLDMALDKLNNDFAEFLAMVESGGLDPLDDAGKVAGLTAAQLTWTTSPCCAATTMCTFCRKAGAAASTTTGCPSGHHATGSTASSYPE